MRIDRAVPYQRFRHPDIDQEQGVGMVLPANFPVGTNPDGVLEPERILALRQSKQVCLYGIAMPEIMVGIKSVIRFSFGICQWISKQYIVYYDTLPIVGSKRITDRSVLSEYLARLVRFDALPGVSHLPDEKIIRRMELTRRVSYHVVYGSDGIGDRRDGDAFLLS